MTVVAAGLRVDDVASLANQRRIEPFHVQWNRRELGASLNPAALRGERDHGPRRGGADEKGHYQRASRDA